MFNDNGILNFLLVGAVVLGICMVIGGNRNGGLLGMFD